MLNDDVYLILILMINHYTKSYYIWWPFVIWYLCIMICCLLSPSSLRSNSFITIKLTELQTFLRGEISQCSVNIKLLVNNTYYITLYSVNSNVFFNRSWQCHNILAILYFHMVNPHLCVYICEWTYKASVLV